MGNMKWYIAKCPTGAENTALRSLNELLSKMHLTEHLGEFFIPYDKNVKRTQRRSNMANYVFIQLDLTPAVQDVLNKVEVMNLMLDEDLLPIVTADEEIEKMRAKIVEAKEASEKTFVIGQLVKVMEPPFEDFTATIEKIDEAKLMASVSVPILGRQISVELPFKSIKRITD